MDPPLDNRLNDLSPKTPGTGPAEPAPVPSAPDPGQDRGVPFARRLRKHLLAATSSERAATMTLHELRIKLRRLADKLAGRHADPGEVPDLDALVGEVLDEAV